jgi:hypothetical protein
MAFASACRRRGLIAIVAMLLSGLLLVPSLRPSMAATTLTGLRADEGLLHVTSSPPVASRIAVGDVERNTSAIAGLPLPAGAYDVCFSAADGYLAPPCRTVQIRAGELTSIVGIFEPVGHLSVTVEPSGLVPQIFIDGLARDRGSVLLPVGAGERRVCAQPLPGYLSPECHVVIVTAGAFKEVVLAYTPAAVAGLQPDPEPGPDPEAELQPVPLEDAGLLEVSVEPGAAQQSKGPTWSASVTVEVRRSDEPVGGIAVDGVWDTSTLGTCLTGHDGRCTIVRPNLHNRDKAATFRVTQLGDEAVDGTVTTVTR